MRNKLFRYFRNAKIRLLRCFLLSVLFMMVVSVHPADAQMILLSQPRNTAPALFDDADCDPCGGPDILAENFIMTRAATIIQIRVWGGYWSGDIAPANDNFTVIFHYDSGGLPGPYAAPAEFNVPVSRVDTGINMNWFGTETDEYEFTLTLVNPVRLTSGTYWVELYNDTIGHTANNDFYWRRAGIDPVYGIAGIANSLSAPGTNWVPYFIFNELAIDIIAASPVPAPTMTEWGMTIFMVFAVAGSVYCLRKKRAEC